MFLTKKKKREITKDIAFVATALISSSMESRLFGECQQRLIEIADNIGGIEMVADINNQISKLQKEIVALKKMEEDMES